MCLVPVKMFVIHKRDIIAVKNFPLLHSLKNPLLPIVDTYESRELMWSNSFFRPANAFHRLQIMLGIFCLEY
jgi:hypothetical protein